MVRFYKKGYKGNVKYNQLVNMHIPGWIIKIKSIPVLIPRQNTADKMLLLLRCENTLHFLYLSGMEWKRK